MKARCIGQAANPGPNGKNVTCRLLNIEGGGRLKADHLAQLDTQVTLLTELELADFAVPNFRATMREHGVTAILAPSSSITKDTDKICGRRAGILTTSA